MQFLAKIAYTLVVWFLISVVVELGVRTVRVILPALKSVFTFSKIKLAFAR